MFDICFGDIDVLLVILAVRTWAIWDMNRKVLIILAIFTFVSIHSRDLARRPYRLSNRDLDSRLLLLLL